MEVLNIKTYFPAAAVNQFLFFVVLFFFRLPLIVTHQNFLFVSSTSLIFNAGLH